MCSMFFPRSSRRTRSPFSVSSLAAHPPEIPDPTTIASYVVDCTAASALIVVDQKVHQKLGVSYDCMQLNELPRPLFLSDGYCECCCESTRHATGNCRELERSAVAENHVSRQRNLRESRDARLVSSRRVDQIAR